MFILSHISIHHTESWSVSSRPCRMMKHLPAYPYCTIMPITYGWEIVCAIPWHIGTLCQAKSIILCYSSSLHLISANPFFFYILKRWFPLFLYVPLFLLCACAIPCPLFLLKDSSLLPSLSFLLPYSICLCIGTSWLLNEWFFPNDQYIHYRNFYLYLIFILRPFLLYPYHDFQYI